MQAKSREQMSRAEFAAEKITPRGMDFTVLESCPETLQEWRDAVLYHYCDLGADLSDRMRNRKNLEAAYAALKSAYRMASQRKECVAA